MIFIIVIISFIDNIVIDIINITIDTIISIG